MRIIKRNGIVVQFNPQKIHNAIEKCYFALWNDKTTANAKAEKYTKEVARRLVGFEKSEAFTKENNLIHIEYVQDIVQKVLVENYEFEAHDCYARYRNERAYARDVIDSIPNELKSLYSESKSYFKSPLQLFQYYDKYSRFDWEQGRRETWKETVCNRAMPFMIELSENKLGGELYRELEKSMLNTWAMSSMRLLASAGPAARRDNVCIYNCSFIAIDDIECFVEALHISMCGCGVGFSTEEHYVNNLPEITPQMGVCHTITVDDTTEGWGAFFRFFINTLFNGEDIDPDVSNLRPAGAILKTKGGRASGPEPLLFAFYEIRKIILSAQGRKLTPFECLCIMCLIGECAVSGGVRRTAMICISDMWDTEIANCKKGNWYNERPYLRNANISASFIRNYDLNEIEKFVKDMDESKMGERGIFSPINAIKNAPERRVARWTEELKEKYNFTLNFAENDSILQAARLLKIGTNPCGEINLRTFCNLSINILRPGDSHEYIFYKQRIATILGTIQSKATYFPHLRPHWKEITEQERLLGVDLLGLTDYGYMSNELMRELMNYTVEVNKEYAEKLNINCSSAVTAIKPGGNSSALFDTSSSISKRKHQFSLRNVEVDIRSPVYKVFSFSKVPGFPKPNAESSSYIFQIPTKAPEGALLLENDSLADQLQVWMNVKLNYTEHNPSCTLYYKEEELEYLIHWIYNHQNILGGLTFFPHIDLEKLNVPYLPIQKISEEEYYERMRNFPEIKWELLAVVEKSDMTNATKELACSGGNCEIV